MGRNTRKAARRSQSSSQDTTDDNINNSNSNYNSNNNNNNDDGFHTQSNNENNTYNNENNNNNNNNNNQKQKQKQNQEIPPEDIFTNKNKNHAAKLFAQHLFHDSKKNNIKPKLSIHTNVRDFFLRSNMQTTSSSTSSTSASSTSTDEKQQQQQQQQDYSIYSIGGSDLNKIMDFWSTLSLKDKKAIVSDLKKSDILHSWSEFTKYQIEIVGHLNEENVKRVVVQFLYTMETKKGLFEIYSLHQDTPPPPTTTTTTTTQNNKDSSSNNKDSSSSSSSNQVELNISLESILILKAIEKKLLYSYYRKDLLRQITLIVFYLLWNHNKGYGNIWRVSCMGFFIVYLFIDLHKYSKLSYMHYTLCDIIEKALISEQDDGGAITLWRGEAFLSSFLLYLMCETRKWFFMVSIFITVPYILHQIQSFTLQLSNLHGPQANDDDTHILRKMRTMMIFINKFLLLCFSFSRYSSLLLVSALYFFEISIFLLGLGMIGSALLLQVLSTVIWYLIPQIMKSVLEAFWQGRNGWNKNISLTVMIIVIPIVMYYYTSQMISQWKCTLLRFLTILIIGNLIPYQDLTVILQMIFMLPVKIMQKCSELYKRYKGYNHNGGGEGEGSKEI